MAKLRDKPILASDMLDYLESYSDFSFELQTLRLVRDCGLECAHGGLYEDPVTKKMREFDLRAVARVGPYIVRLAIECKNIRENFPLLVSCVPRQASESFNEIALLGQGSRTRSFLASGLDLTPGGLSSPVRILRLKGDNSRYTPHQPVGKSISQVGRSVDKSNTIIATDAEIFERWGQCLSSASDLVDETYWEGHKERESTKHKVAAVIPILAVPDGRLWRVEYGLDGERKDEPALADRCSMLVDMVYTVSPAFSESYRISHLEIMTVSGLGGFLRDSLRTREGMQAIFSNAGVYDAMQAGLSADAER